MKEEGEKFILKVVERPIEILNRNLVDYIEMVSPPLNLTLN